MKNNRNGCPKAVFLPKKNDVIKPRSDEACCRADRKTLHIILKGVRVSETSLHMDEYYGIFGSGKSTSSEKRREIKVWIGRSQWKEERYETWKKFFKGMSLEEMIAKVNRCLPFGRRWESVFVIPADLKKERKERKLRIPSLFAGRRLFVRSPQDARQTTP